MTTTRERTMAVVNPDGRPVRWLTDEEFCALVAHTPREGDRLILLALRLHDGLDNAQGPYPGYRRIAELTGLAVGTVRNRLASMPLERYPVGRFTAYLMRPVTSGDDMSLPEVTGADVSLPEVTSEPRRVTDMSLSWVHRNRNKSLKTETSPTLSEGTGSENGKKPTRGTWLTPFASAWEAQYGGHPSFGRLAKALDPLVKQHGPDVVLESWRRYLADTSAKYAAPEKFAQTFGSWAPAADPAIARALRESARASGGPA